MNRIFLIGIFLFFPLLSLFSFTEAEILFEEVTNQSGISYSGPSWGSSWGDFNGDGWPDLWSNGHRGQFPSLYMNNGNGTFSEILLSEISNVTTLKDPHGAAWADFDNDGDQDIILLTGAERGLGEGKNYLFKNDNGSLIDIATDLGVDYNLGRGRTPIWFDYNSDGKLDLLIVNWPRPDEQAPTALFLQTESGFEVVKNLGIKEFMHNTASVQISDLDGDKQMELIARTPAPRGVFEINEMSLQNKQDKLKLPEFWSIDLAISDFNSDLLQDIYFTMMSPDTSEINNKTNSDYAEKIFINTHDGFENVTSQSGLEKQKSCRSVVAGDFDNDMDIDLYLVCTHPLQNIPNVLYENQGNGDFIIVIDAGGASGSKEGIGDSVTLVDFDADGFLDLFVTNGLGPEHQNDLEPNQLFRNLGNENHWLEIDLLGTISNNDGIGSSILIKTRDVTQLREQAGGMHSHSQNHKRIHVGLGEYTEIDSIVVYWPSGIVHEIMNTSADQILQIVEPTTPIPPRQQTSLGIEKSSVLCREGLELIFKATNGIPACVKPSTLTQLIERGWVG